MYINYINNTIVWKIIRYLPGCCLHSTNGSPIVGGGQEQTGLWLIVWQIASYPHTPIHGSTHLLFTQALLRGQSGLITHSGRHPLVVGDPSYPCKHSQIAAPFITRQRVFGPQGDGTHGSDGTGSKQL